MNKPLISIIVPAYNASNWIQDCCESILNQNYPYIELIVVDDGSTDKTLSILERIKAKNDGKMIVIHTNNCGVSRARNTGLNSAKGEYFMFVDADDTLLPGAIELLYNQMQKYNASMAVGQKKILKQNGIVMESSFLSKTEVWTGEDGLINSLKDHPATYSVWGKLYETRFFSNIRFVEGKRVHEDSYYIFECMLQKPKVVIVDNFVILYKETLNSASRAPFNERMFDILFFLERKIDIIKHQYPHLVNLSNNMIIKSNMAVLYNLSFVSSSKYKSIEIQCINNIKNFKKYFIPVSRSNKLLFFSVIFNFFWLYKLLRFVKMKK